MSFVLVRHRSSGEVVVTSSSAAGIRSVLQREAGLVASDKVYDTVKELYADAPAMTRVLSGPADVAGQVDPEVQASVPEPSIEHGVDGIRVEMAVIDDRRRLQVWAFDLPWQGEAKVTRKTLATVRGVQ